MKKNSIAFYGTCLAFGILNYWMPDGLLFQVLFVLVAITTAIIISNKVKKHYNE